MPRAPPVTIATLRAPDILDPLAFCSAGWTGPRHGSHCTAAIIPYQCIPLAGVSSNVPCAAGFGQTPRNARHPLAAFERCNCTVDASGYLLMLENRERKIKTITSD